jgi:hypothetical protein
LDGIASRWLKDHALQNHRVFQATDDTEGQVGINLITERSLTTVEKYRRANRLFQHLSELAAEGGRTCFDNRMKVLQDLARLWEAHREAKVVAVEAYDDRSTPNADPNNNQELNDDEIYQDMARMWEESQEEMVTNDALQTQTTAFTFDIQTLSEELPQGAAPELSTQTALEHQLHSLTPVSSSTSQQLFSAGQSSRRLSGPRQSSQQLPNEEQSSQQLSGIRQLSHQLPNGGQSSQGLNCA